MYRMNNKLSRKAALDLFDAFYRNVYNIENIDLPPPLELLSKCCADAVSKKSNNSEEEAIALWRSGLQQYTDMRCVDGLFVRVAAVYERRQQRLQAQMRQERQADLMRSQKPKPLVLTERGQKQQIKYVRDTLKGKIRAENRQSGVKRDKEAIGGGEGDSLGAIGAMMGISLTKKAKK